MKQMPQRQIAAAVQVARAHGLRHAEPTVLADGVNTVVRLAPYDVVAKVAAVTYRVRDDPAAWLARELDLAIRLDRSGLPVTVPSPDLPAQVHVQDGLAMTFWRHLPHDRAATPAPDEAGRLLGELHEALAAVEIDLPLLAPALLDIPAFLALAPNDRLSEAYERLAPQARGHGPIQPLHGDPHPGNLLLGADGWTWCDPEDCCSGPRSWDLAALHETTRLNGPAAVRAAAADVDPDELAVMCELRRLHLTCWYQLHADERPDVRAEADRRLAEW